jgi:hypothetical protein
MKKIVLLFFYVLALTQAGAQEKKYQITLAAGAAQIFGFKNLASPGYSGKLLLEKLRDKETTMGFFIDYIKQPAKPSDDLTLPTGVIQTTKFYPGSIATLTFGGRKYKDNGLVFGAGAGLGIFTQYAPTKTYSDGSNFYESYQRGTGGVGVGINFLGGYKKGPLQFMLTGTNVWTPVKTITYEEEKSDPTSVVGLSLTLAYSF